MRKHKNVETGDELLHFIDISQQLLSSLLIYAEKNTPWIDILRITNILTTAHDIFTLLDKHLIKLITHFQESK